MNIIYATRAAIPYPSAASLNSVQMCESLVELGHRVILAVGRKLWRRAGDARAWRQHYGFQPRFAVARLWELPRTGWGFDGAILRLARDHRALVYSRFPRVFAHHLARRVPAVLEIHSSVGPRDRRRMGRALAQGSLLGVVVITEVLREHLLGFAELRPFRDRFLVAPDAVDSRRFAAVPSHLDLDQIGYVGSLYPGKGMEQIVQISERRPNLRFQIFGGRPAELRRWQELVARRTNIDLHGYVSPPQVPSCLSRFGIALLPNQPSVRLPNGDDIGRFTSPMKLFEYIAAGRAIIASDLTGLREVLRHEVNCLLVPHNDPTAWVEAIDRLRRQPDLARQLAARARVEAENKYSYRRRFQAILDRFSPSLPRESGS